jgi:hypothetical protein
LDPTQVRGPLGDIRGKRPTVLVEIAIQLAIKEAEHRNQGLFLAVVVVRG